MEEISAREAAGSPRVQFQSLETQYEGLPPEPQVVQDTAMEQGLAGVIKSLQVPVFFIPELPPSTYAGHGTSNEAGFRGQGHKGLHVGYRPGFYLPGLPACRAGHCLSFLGAPCERGVRRSVFQWLV
ncbi:zinc finger protein 655 [Rhinolophus ferrumequinum]|uniref:Zinc finger protein 655 n=1 Tax=Rhinolophus ferrumequinum TaxID=59479 RepID=A0A7J7Y8E2_RHIFE|nr:zinc finger protein 655 [Rhinolophus ferrumequinum]